MSLVRIALPAPRKSDLCRWFLLRASHREICQWKKTTLVCTASSSSSRREVATPPKTVTDLVNFKPPPHVPPPSPQELASEIPFQYWYSYSDLPPGVAKKRPKRSLFAAVKDSPARKEKGAACEGETLNKCTSEATVKGEMGAPADGKILEQSIKEATSPLTKKEKRELLKTCLGSNRQISIGWGGWSINYVAQIHNYWKKSPVCKIKCKGAITLDMDSVCNTLEEKTGGQVIHCMGGAVYLFRGRQYHYWENPPKRPIVRQKTTQRRKQHLPIPYNLTNDEVLALRARGRDLPALCKLGTNGVYLTLVDDVRKAFETHDLVRVNCQGFKSVSFKTLGARLQALVPCELISYEFEHILMWRDKKEKPLTQQVIEEVDTDDESYSSQQVEESETYD